MVTKYIPPKRVATFYPPTRTMIMPPHVYEATRIKTIMIMSPDDYEATRIIKTQPVPVLPRDRDPYRRLLHELRSRQLLHDPPVPEHEHEQRNWADIPVDALAIVFHKLGEPVVRVFAGAVCRSWWRLATDPAGPYLRCVQGRCIDMRRLPKSLRLVTDTNKLCKAAFDHTAGQIDKLYAVSVSNDLLPLIADRVSNLRFLSLIHSHKVSVSRLHDFLLRHCPLLEELRLYACHFYTPKNGQLGQACPDLKRLWIDGTYVSDDEIDEEPQYRIFSSDVDSDGYSDTDPNSDSCNLLSKGDWLASEIANNMPHLRHLQLVRCNSLTRKGVHAVLDKCLHLESLDLRCCFSLRVDNALHNKLSRIKSVRLSRASRFRQPN